MSRDQIIENQAPPLALKRFPEQKFRERRGSRMLLSSGFTLIELLMVVAIIGIVAALAVPAYVSFIKNAQYARAGQEIRLLEKEIYDYMIQHESAPLILANLSRGTLKDPWGNFYNYSPTPVRLDRFGNELNPDDFDLWSMGSDGSTEVNIFTGGGTGKDDLIRGAGGSFLGLGEDW